MRAVCCMCWVPHIRFVNHKLPPPSCRAATAGICVFAGSSCTLRGLLVLPVLLESAGCSASVISIQYTHIEISGV